MNSLVQVFPEKIMIYKYNKYPIEYRKQYEHDGGGCYYRNDDPNDYITWSFVSLYPNGKLTYLWNGIEKEWNADLDYVDDDIECDSCETDQVNYVRIW